MGRMISAHTALTGANTATGDLFEVVDISVTTDGPGGTNKKITRAELWNAMLQASPSTTLVVTNLDAGASGTAGTIDVNGDDNFQASRDVVAGDTLRARHTSSASYLTATNTLVEGGGVSDTFTSQTGPDPSVSEPRGFGWLATRLGLGN